MSRPCVEPETRFRQSTLGAPRKEHARNIRQTLPRGMHKFGRSSSAAETLGARRRGAACCRGTRRCKSSRGGSGERPSEAALSPTPNSHSTLLANKPARSRLPQTFDYHSLRFKRRLHTPRGTPSSCHRRRPPEESCALPSSSDGPAQCR